MGTSFDKKVRIYVPFMSQMSHLCPIYVPFMSHLCPIYVPNVPFMSHLCPRDLPPDRLHTGQVRQVCASWGRNPKGPKMTPIWLEMGRHPTILDIRGRVLHRIPLRISPDRSTPLNLNFFLTIFWTQNAKKSFSGRKKKTPLRGTLQLPWRAWSQIRPIGAQGAHVAPLGSNPCGPLGGQFRPIWGPWGPHGAPLLAL